MSSGLLNISITGLNAAQTGLLTTSHNIANASTPGYNRQTIVQTPNVALYTGSGYIGQGTSVTNIQRVYNAYLGTQLLGAQATAAQLSSYSDQIGNIDNLLGSTNSSLSPSLQTFFSAMSTAAANPSSLAARQSVLSSAQTLAGSFQTLSDQMSQMRSGVNSQITTTVGSINSLSTQISAINQQIVSAPRSSDQQQPNDLLDQRDQLISSLNNQVRVTTHLESDGSMSVFFGTGQPLVVGGSNYQMTVQPDPADATHLQIGLKTSNTASTIIPESLVTGGTLGGLLSYRTQTLDPAQNALGSIALALATTMNSQHQLGQDLNGNLGGNLFNPISLSTSAATTNAGTGALSANITVSDYKVTYSAGSYNITRLSDNTNLGAFGNLPQMVDGVNISLSSGVPANGDSFTVSPAAQAGKRVMALSTNTGTATIDSTGSNLQTLTNSDYRLTLTAANTFSLTRLSDNQVWTGVGASQASALSNVLAQAGPQGFSLKLSGTMSVGDSFLVQPTRNAASDLSVAISDPSQLALATPLVTGAAGSNAGTATISSGQVNDTSAQLSAPFSVSYDAATNSLVGFPVGSSVSVGSQSFTVTTATTRIPFSAGSNISLDGVGVAISGAPADGDTFTINPPPAASTAGGANTGSGAIAAGIATNSKSLPSSQFSLVFHPATTSPVQPDRLQGFPVGTVVTVTPSGGQPATYTVSSTTDTVPYTSGANISFNGISFSISGKPIDGDTFTVGPNPSAVSDSRNAGLLGSLQTASTMVGGNASYQDAYAQLVATVGNQANAVTVQLTAQQSLVTQNQNAIQSNSGVNLDEEAANLMRFQQAYQASAKVISVANTLFNQMLQMFQ